MTARGNAVLTLGALALLIALEAWRLANPAPAPADAPADQFSATRTIAVLREVSIDAPHALATPGHDVVRDRLIAALRALDYQVDVEHVFACNAYAQCGAVDNLIARRPDDAASTRPAVVVAAHYDSVPAGPGASDDGTGVATALELARIVRREPLANPIVFLIDDGEEAGLLGAEGYVADAARGRDAAFVINLEARGTGGTPFLFETSREQGWLIPIVARALPHPITSSLDGTIYDLLPNDTDLTVFKRAGRAGINFAYVGGFERYHTPLDDLAHVDAGAVQRRGDQVLAMVRAFGQASLGEAAPGQAIWFDVFGAVVVWWPASASLAIAAVAFILAALAIRRGRRVQSIRLGGVGLGLASLIAIVVAAAVLGDALLRILAIHTGGAQDIPHPGPMLAAAGTAGLACALAIGGLMRRWANADALLAGQALGWLALGVALALMLPGAAYVAIVPGAALAIALLARMFLRVPAVAVALAGLVAAATVLLPFALFGYAALGTPIITAIAVMLGLLGAGLAPVLGAHPGEPRGVTGRLALAALVATIALAAVALATPAESAEAPVHVSLAHITTADTGDARWQTAEPTPAVRALAPFRQAQVAPWFGASGSAEVAPAPRLAIAAPTAALTVGPIQPDGTRVLTLDLASARGAPRLALAWQSEAELVAVKVNDTPLPARPARFHSSLRPGWHRLQIRGGAARVQLTVRGTAPGRALLSDTSFGLPAIGAPLAAVRDATGAVPVQDGDVTMVERPLSW
ncbi:MAG TPA: M20/M25/M40 family metallo-hydrolase [Kofleriaceae bacterium]